MDNYNFKSGDRVSWQYTHYLNSRSSIEIIKKGEYLGKIKHTSRYWNNRHAVQKVAVKFDGNIHVSKVPIYSLKKI